jgi:hypothetical protein
MFELAVEIRNICGSAHADSRIFINTTLERRWMSMSNCMKLKYTKRVY